MAMDKTILSWVAPGAPAGWCWSSFCSAAAPRPPAIVRSPRKLPPGVAQDLNLTVVEAHLLSICEADLLSQVRGCRTLSISCLGHVTDIKGIFGSPCDLVTQATTRLCRTITALQASEPVKYILMSSVSVHHPEGLDVRRGRADKAVMWVLRSLVPPSKDNQRAADFLFEHIRMSNPCVQWVVVRPDTLVDGSLSQYALHENLVSSLFKPDKTNMANVAHFMEGWWKLRAVREAGRANCP